MGRKSLGRTNGNARCDGEKVAKRKRGSRNIFGKRRRRHGPEADSFGIVHKEDVSVKTERKSQTNQSLRGDTVGEEYLGKKCNASNKNQLVGSRSSARGKSVKEHTSFLEEVKIKRNPKPGTRQCHVPQVDSFETFHVEDASSRKEHYPQTDLSWEGERREENFVENSGVSNQICQVGSPLVRFEEKGKVHPYSLEEERITCRTQKKTSGKRCRQSAEVDPRGNSGEEHPSLLEEERITCRTQKKTSGKRCCQSAEVDPRGNSGEEQLEKNNASSQNLQPVSPSSKNLHVSSLSSGCYHPFSSKEEDVQNHKKKNKYEKRRHYFLRSHHANDHHDKREIALQTCLSLVGDVVEKGSGRRKFSNKNLQVGSHFSVCEETEKEPPSSLKEEIIKNCKEKNKSENPYRHGLEVESLESLHIEDASITKELDLQTGLSSGGGTIENDLGRISNTSNRNLLVSSCLGGFVEPEKELPSSLEEANVGNQKKNNNSGKRHRNVLEADSLEFLHLEGAPNKREHDPETGLTLSRDAIEEDSSKNCNTPNQNLQAGSPSSGYREHGKGYLSSLEEEKMENHEGKLKSEKLSCQDLEVHSLENTRILVISNKKGKTLEEDVVKREDNNIHDDHVTHASSVDAGTGQRLEVYPKLEKVEIYRRKKIQSGDLEPNEVNVEIKGGRQYPSSLSNRIGDHHLAIKDKGSPVHVLSPPPEGPVGIFRKKLIVLDVNGLLADILPVYSVRYEPDKVISGKAVFKRPFCIDFLKFCFQKFEVGIWSSRIRRNLDFAVDFLFGDLKDHLLFCWHQSHCTETGFTTIEDRQKPLFLKELKKLWEKQEAGLPWRRGEYNESNTLLLDDSPYKALRNPPYTAIFPPPYCYEDRNDDALGPWGSLRVYLESLAVAENVQHYIQRNPFGQEAISEASVHWEYYNRVLTYQHCRL